MFSRLVLALIFLSLVFIIPTRYDGDQIFLTYALAVIVLSGWFVEPRRDVKCLGLALLSIWAIITLALDFQFYEQDTILKALLGVMAIKTIADRADLSVYSFGWFLFWVSFAASVYLGLQLAGLDPYYQRLYQDSGSFFGKPWVMGCFGAISFPILWRFRWWAVVPVLPLIYFSYSKICVAVACLLGLFLLPGRWKLLGWVCLPISAVGYAIMDGDGGNHRLLVWKSVWDYTLPYLSYGKGLGSFFNSAFAHSDGSQMHHWPWLHNEFYQYLFEQGIPGLALILGWYLTLIWAVSDRYLRLSLMAIGVLCMFHPVMHFPKLIAVCIPILALSQRDSAGILSLKLQKESVWLSDPSSRKTCRTP